MTDASVPTADRRSQSGANGLRGGRPSVDPKHRGVVSWGGRAARRMVVSWVASLGLHVFLLALMFAVVFPFAPKEAEPVPPDVRLRIVGSLDATTSVSETTSDQPLRSIPVDETPVRFQPEVGGSPAQVLPARKTDLEVIGIGAAGGDFDRLGLSIGGGAIPEFFGVGSTSRAARRIVYVVDRSGSMIDTFDFVRAELRRSISAMRRSQKFHVIFFSAGAPLENPPQKLVSAIEANKQAAFAFFETVLPRGGTEPAAALARALDLEPDLVYLLSDGVDFAPDLMDRLNDWNRSRSVQICTIAYIDPGGRDVLERIAREHNGEFKFVSEYDLP